MPNGGRRAFSGEHAIPEWLVFGRSKAMLEVRSAVERVAAVSVPVLIQGEKGTGKEIIAREIHARSAWCSAPFVKLECRATGSENAFQNSNWSLSSMFSAIPPTRLERARSGTLFLDEVSDAKPAVQAKLIALLEESELGHAGSAQDGQSQVRIICATEVDLEQRVAFGHFRSDVFYRISVVKVQLPRLRDRSEDIADLAEYFLATRQHHRFHRVGFSPAVLRLLCEYHWPGNVRQLEHCVSLYADTGDERAVLDELVGKPAMDRFTRDSCSKERHSRF